jgi:hypothetical protein
MMKKLIYILPLLFLLTGCEKNQEKKVSYLITRSASGFNVNYRTADGTLSSEQIVTESAEDRWTYDFIAEEGDIVFVSAIYKDLSSSILVQILVDGKVYKQGSSKQDTVSFVTVSGTVPYE